MPTGYTAKLMESGQTFPEFAMTCARAFGACILMRDDDMDVPIPEKFEPSNYHLEAIEKAKAQLQQFEAMSIGERWQYGIDQKVEQLRQNNEWLEKEKAENARIDAMIAEVNNWVPPTEEHEEMKRFMLDQLKISRNTLTYQEERLKALNNKDPKTFYLDAVQRAEHDIAYHTAEHAKEVQRTNERTRWVQQLRESLSTKQQQQ